MHYKGWNITTRQNPRWAWRDFKKWCGIGKKGQYHYMLEHDKEQGAIDRVKKAIDISPDKCR